MAEEKLAGRHVHSIILVRHGQTSYNAEHRWQGQIDIPLNAVGLWQVERTGEELRRRYVDAAPGGRRQLVVASNLGRAFTTAQVFAAPLHLEVHPDSRLRERSFGQWEGVTIEQASERWPEDFRSWMSSTGGELNHGAETKGHVGARGAQAIEDWAGRAGDDTDLFVFSHGSLISQSLQTLLGMSRTYPEFANMDSMRNAHWARLTPRDLPDGQVRWCLVEYNLGPAIAMRGDWDEPRDVVAAD